MEIEISNEQREGVAWLAVAVLSHLTLGVGLKEKSLELIHDIRTSEEDRAIFDKALESLQVADEFDIVEMDRGEAMRVRQFVLVG